MTTTKVFGPPGSGKTTYLLRIVEQELADETHPMKIGYFAFTKKAATEARERAITKFPHLNPDLDFPFFRTLHSLAYRCLGIGTKDMMSPDDYKEFAAEAGITVATEHSEEDFNVKVDHPILNEINIARIKSLDLRTHYNQSRIQIEWHHFEYVERAYRQYKTSRALLDYTDLLEHVLLEPDRLPHLETLIIDEAQDLSLLQWKLVEQLALRSQRCFLAGDDDQAVFNWAGADVQRFLTFPGEVKILDQSYRVPSAVHLLANKVVNRIRNRQPKVWKARAEKGSVTYHNNFMHVDLTQGDWLLLASANYMLSDVQEWVKGQGLLYERHGHRSISESVLTAVLGWEKLRKGGEVPFAVVKAVYKYMDSECVKHGHKTLRHANTALNYTLQSLVENHGLLTTKIWHEVLTKLGAEKRDYIIALLRRNTKLTGHVPIKLSTIHGAKGGEADNVLLLTDLSTRHAAEYHTNPDDINRLLYVGITRAKQTLHLIQPKNVEKCFLL